MVLYNSMDFHDREKIEKVLRYIFKEVRSHPDVLTEELPIFRYWHAPDDQGRIILEKTEGGIFYASINMFFQRKESKMIPYDIAKLLERINNVKSSQLPGVIYNNFTERWSEAWAKKLAKEKISELKRLEDI